MCALFRFILTLNIIAVVRMDVFFNKYCPNMKPLHNIAIEQLTGMWYGVEIISQKENDERYGLRQINSCPIIYISEKNSPTNPNPRNENNTDSYGTVYGKSEYQRYAEDIKRLTLLWDENGSYVEYSLRYNTSKPGLWISSGSNNGSSLEEQYNKFDGMVQVIKAVGNHLTLTFCRQLPDQQLYTALLSRVPTLAQHEISDVHDLLAKRGLETYNSIKVCAQSNSSNPVLSQ